MGKLTGKQREQAWRLLMTTHNNTDAEIAKRIGFVTAQQVSLALAEMEAEKMKRINKEVNKRYEERKANRKHETTQLRSRWPMEVQPGEGNKILAGKGDDVNTFRTLGNNNKF